MIPELPEGCELVISINTTWGDKHYVGLNGIEIHTATGQHAPIAKVRLLEPCVYESVVKCYVTY